MTNLKTNEFYEKLLVNKQNGPIMLLINLIALFASFALFALGAGRGQGILIVLAIFLFLISGISFAGFKILGPNEAYVFTLFGSYIGTLKGPGFYYVNPFSVANNPASETKLGQSKDVENKKLKEDKKDEVSRSNKKLSLKTQTLNNAKQKVNDVLGNPIDIGVAVMWEIDDTAKAVFNVENYKEYLSIQTDAAVRNIVKIYPYDKAPDIDTTGDGKPDDGSLRGSTTVVAERIKEEIQSRVEFAGIKIIEARITYLAYSLEIAAAMLQRQQAQAIVDAREIIVDGAVGMVDMALEKLEDQNIVDLDEERKAAMVSNLLVVLCSGSEVSPVVNSGTLY